MEQSASSFSYNESLLYFDSQNHLSLVRGMFMKPSRVQVLHGRNPILSPFKWPLRLQVILQALLHHVKGDLCRVIFKSNQSSKPSLPTGELNRHQGKAGNIRHCPGPKYTNKHAGWHVAFSPLLQEPFSSANVDDLGILPGVDHLLT